MSTQIVTVMFDDPVAYIKQKTVDTTRQIPLYSTGDIAQRVGTSTLFLRYGGASGIKQRVAEVVQELL